MTLSENRKRYISLHKILFVFTLSIIATLCTGASAYAAEITPTVEPTVTPTVAPADTASSTVITTAPVAPSDSIDTTTQTQDGTLEDGYTVDDQGQVYYNGVAVTSEEIEIMEIPEEDTEDMESDMNATEADTADSDAAVSEPEEEAEAEEAAEETSTDKTSDKTTTKTTTKTSTKETSSTTSKTTQKAEKPSYSEADLRLLSCLIYAEAGNQSYKGMVAVANVVMNRAKSNVYWHVNTIKEVIYDRKWSVQFSVTIENSKTGISPLEKALKIYDTGKYTGANPDAQKKSMQRAIKAAKAALEGTNNIGNYLCFTNKNAAGSIKKKYPDYKIIGDHIFYRTK